MSEYYGVSTPTSDFLAHYGVKGMKWGVRKAIQKANVEKLKEHHRKAEKKLYSLQNKANLLTKKSEQRNGYGLAAFGGALAGAGTAANLLAIKSLKKNGRALISPTVAISAPVLGALSVGVGAKQAISARRLSKAKGHAKAVKKVNDWQKSMKDTFKGTSFEKAENRRKPYDDVYSITDYSSGEPKTVARISGDRLVRNYKGSDKKAFISEAQKKYRTMASPNTHDKNPESGMEMHVSEYLKGAYKDPNKKRKKKVIT